MKGGLRHDLRNAHRLERVHEEVYACDDSQKKFVRDFVAPWNKVMNLAPFDLA